RAARRVAAGGLLLRDSPGAVTTDLEFALVSSGNDIDLQPRVGRGHGGRRQTQLTAGVVAPLRDRARLVERDLAVAALPAESAVARNDQPFGRDVLQRISNLARDVLGPIGLQHAMADRTDADLLLQIVLERLEELEISLAAILHLESPH